MPDIRDERAREIRERSPRAVKALEYQGRAVLEFPKDLICVKLVSDLGTETARAGKARPSEDASLLRHSRERGAQAAISNEFVDSRRTEQVGEVLSEFRCARQEWFLAPVFSPEDRGKYGDESRKGGPEIRPALSAQAQAEPSAPPSCPS